jgi:RNA polymerase sigma factor (sigma-70 family)
VEASALPSRLTRSRAPLSAAVLRLRSDEQLVALFRAGSDDAFRAIHDRYRTRLLAYARQMLRGAHGDAEDALQDVFLRAYGGLRRSNRPVILRAWLYRIAHNRCIDELRRPRPLPSELEPDAEPTFGATRASTEPPVVAERTAALARLVADVQTLPGQQRSALLMRELQGLTYEELAVALGVSVPAVKSLLLRARTGLIDLATARDTPCAEIRDELIVAADRSVRISGRARRHCAECTHCAAYRGELRRVRQGFAALTPGGPLAQLGVLLGIGGGGGAAAVGGGAATGGGVIAAKVAVAVCCAALIGTAAAPEVLAPSHHATHTAATPAAATASGPVAHTASALPAAPTRSDSTATATAQTEILPLAGSVSLPPPSHGGGPTATIGVPGASGSADGGTSVAGSGLGGPGATGQSGATGASGTTGATGATGGTGATGVTGATGASGASGASGSTDPSDGPSGPTGASGATFGASGASGATGSF